MSSLCLWKGLKIINKSQETTTFTCLVSQFFCNKLSKSGCHLKAHPRNLIGVTSVEVKCNLVSVYFAVEFWRNTNASVCG